MSANPKTIKKMYILLIILVCLSIVFTFYNLLILAGITTVLLIIPSFYFLLIS